MRLGELGRGLALGLALVATGCPAGAPSADGPVASEFGAIAARPIGTHASAVAALDLTFGSCLAWDGITWDPGATGAPVALSNGNLTAQVDVFWTRSSTRATQFVTSGKWYWELSLDDDQPRGAPPQSDPMLGVGMPGAPLTVLYIGGDWNGWGYIPTGSSTYHNSESGGSFSYAASAGDAVVGDVIGVALDADDGTLAFFKNGAALGTAFTDIPPGKPLYPMLGSVDWPMKATARFAPPFSSPVPAGFAPLDCAPCGGPDQSCCAGGLCDSGNSCSANTCIPACASGTTWNPPSHACIPSCSGVTWDPADTGATIVLSNGDLTANGPQDFQRAVARATQGAASGKWYWELTIDDEEPPNATALSYPFFGIATAAMPVSGYYPGSSTFSWGFDPISGSTCSNYACTFYTASLAGVGDVLGVALDADDGTLAFSRNGVSLGTAFSGLPAGTPLYPIAGEADRWFKATGRFAPPFEYAAPDGYSPFGCVAANGDAGAPDGGAPDGSVDSGAPDAAPDGNGSGGCGAKAGTPPTGPPVCGDGWRDPATEECDDGLGASMARRACNAQCQVIDELAVVTLGADGGVANAPRTLGNGRHPVAASDRTFAVVSLEPSASPPTLSLASFSATGVPGAVLPFSGGSTVVDGSNPVVAALPCDRYAVAWADFVSEGGDELDVALALVDPTATPPQGPPAHANTSTPFSQLDPDILWTGSELVVAWVDDSNPATQPDLRFRTFDANLNPTSGEQTLAATVGIEADVTLATNGAAWAAAWRDDTGGSETIQVQAGSSAWSVVPAFRPAPAAAKPALAALDATHWLVAYAVGVDDGDAGVASGSKIQVAVLDASAPGPVSGVDLPATAPGSTGLDQSLPVAVAVQGRVYLSWWTAAPLGDPTGEELWLKPVGWNAGNLDLGAPEAPLPRWPQARLGDQRAPAMAASGLSPGGALVVAWDDLGGGIAPGEGQEDVVLELIPAPPLRTSGDAGP